MLIVLKSQLTGRENTMELPITPQQWHAWNTGCSTVEKCFPQLNPEQQQFILNGTTKEEWDNYYGDEDRDSNIPKELDID